MSTLAKNFILNFKDELKHRIQTALSLLDDCTICPRRCGVNRTLGETGFCGVGRLARVASAHLHFGEEDPLVGQGGSGTIFFSGCNLECVFCQNQDISRDAASGQEVTALELARIMIALQEQGAENINFVTPTHVTPQILESLPLALDLGLRIPLVYNTGSYDLVSTLRLLDGIVDIYLPDAKIWDPDMAAPVLNARDYPEHARLALVEMHRQTGAFSTGGHGRPPRGVLVRHLVLPGDLAGSSDWFDFLRTALSPDTLVNVMGQYHPCGPARSIPGLDRMTTPQEVRQPRKQAREHGLRLCAP